MKTLVKDVSAGSLYIPQRADPSIFGDKWISFLDSIRSNKVTPVIGPEACAPWIPLPNEIARKWEVEYEYPLENSHQLPEVAQSLEVDLGSRYEPKEILSREIRSIDLPDFSLENFRNTPPAVLADLDLPIYITTNYDNLIEAALVSRGKEPVSEFCRWNEEIENFTGVHTVFEKGKEYKYKTSAVRPLVYHLFGSIDEPRSMVLTERDYMDFTKNLIKDEQLLPSVIRMALATTSLMIIGYNLPGDILSDNLSMCVKYNQATPSSINEDSSTNASTTS